MDFKKMILWTILPFITVLSSIAQENNSMLFSFGVITDVQYVDAETAGTRHYRSSPAKLTAIVDSLNTQKVDFVIHLGDLIDRDFASFDPLLKILGNLTMPVHHVLGNHDFSVKQEQIKTVPDKLGMPSRYYAINHQGIRFIVLDGNELSIYGQKEGSKAHKKASNKLELLKSAGAKNAQAWNGGLSPKQIKWLKSQLDDASKKNEKVIVNCHFPLLPAGDAHNLWNDQEVKVLLATYPNVLAWFNGHNHKGGYHQADGIHYVNFKGIVEKTDAPWAVVEVYADHLIINGHGTEPDRLLEQY